IAEPLRVVINAGMGHAKELQIKAAELSDAGGEQVPAPGAPGPFANRAAKVAWQDVLTGLAFVFGVTAFVLSVLNAYRFRGLRQQTRHTYRIVLVNDGCPSPLSDQLCRQYARTYPERILYVRKKNGGLSSARNRGIKVALATWPSVRAVYLLDADNRLHPHLL